MRALIGVAVVAVALAAAVPAVRAEVADTDRSVLRGIRTVDVLIENMDDAAVQLGFSPKEYRKDTESRLRRAGIRVLTESEAQASDTPIPCLYLRVSAMLQPDIRLAVYTVNLELYDAVFLERAPGTFTLGSIWRGRGMIGKLGTEHVDLVRGNVKDAVDEFITAWSAANPR